VERTFQALSLDSRVLEGGAPLSIAPQSASGSAA
jgi:hypothetical protein